MQHLIRYHSMTSDQYLQMIVVRVIQSKTMCSVFHLIASCSTDLLATSPVQIEKLPRMIKLMNGFDTVSLTSIVFQLQ